MRERDDIIEMLKRIEEKLYAGWNLYIALTFLYWIPVLSAYTALASTSWFQGLRGERQAAVSIAYWAAAVLPVFTLYTKTLKRYLERLEAAAHARRRIGPRRCGLLAAASWPLGIMLEPFTAAALEPLLGPARAQAAALLTFIAVGTLGVSWSEHCASKRLPPSLVAPAITALGIALLPLAPNDVYTAYMFAGSIITVGYSLTAILYVTAALRNI